MEDVPVVLEFRGGAELLFDKKKVHEVVLPKKDKQWCIQDLLYWIKENLLKGRPELFMENDSVRPGILILVNDSDWELLDTVNYEIQPNDRIVFVSTLHGG